MTQLGMRPLMSVPDVYKDFRLLVAHGRFYAIPLFLEPDETNYGTLFQHPATLSAATRQELDALIDQYDDSPYRSEFVERDDDYAVVRHGDTLYAVPQAAGELNLNRDEERRRLGIVRGRTRTELADRLRDLRENEPIEFAGWLPIYEAVANCGNHPQFGHTTASPPGYRFHCSAPPKRRRGLWARVARGLAIAAAGLGKGLAKIALAAGSIGRVLLSPVWPGSGVGIRTRFRVLWAMICLYFRLRRGGGRRLQVLRFLQTRHFTSQLKMGAVRGPVLLPSMPFTFGQNPWLVEIEDPTTLFFPHIQNGATCCQDVAVNKYFPIVKALLEANHCKGIITHM